MQTGVPEEVSEIIDEGMRLGFMLQQMGIPDYLDVQVEMALKTIAYGYQLMGAGGSDGKAS